MTCTKRFANIQWEHHHWRRHVTGFDTMTAEEPDMWARPVYRDYVRCDKEEICDACGAVRHETSCMCDLGKAEQCRLLLEFKSKAGPEAA